MRRSILAALACGAALLFSLALVGCGPSGGDDDDYVEPAKNAKKAKKGPANPIEAGEGTVLRGTVTLRGNKPDLEAMNRAFQDQIRAKKADQVGVCITNAPPEQSAEQDWRLSGEGVGDVVVWLLPPDDNSYFKLDDETLKRFWDEKGEKGPKKDVILDQPHCVFVPRVGWVFPSYTDPNNTLNQKPSSQTFLVNNGAPIAHNTNYSDGSYNKGDLGVIAPKGKSPPLESKLRPNYKAPAHFVCNIHSWMEADVWVFGHPYAAVTKPDGKYEIHNVPAKGKVKIVAWHPKAGFLTDSKSNGDELELEEKNPPKDFTVPAPGG